MGLFEWLWERNQRNRTGHIDTYEQKKMPNTSNGRIAFNFILAVILLTLPFLWVNQSIFAIPGKYLLILALEAIYIFAGYYVNPQPDSDNYGWAGGLIDNPFRISDDINRLLLFLRIILFPGRMFGVFILQFITMLKQRL